MANNIDDLNQSATVANAITAGNTELVAAVCAGVQPARDDAQVWFVGWVQATTGANITSARLRIRQGNGITGTVVGDTGVDPSGIAASTLFTKVVMGIDTAPGAVAQANYSLTIQTAGASPGNTTITKVGLIAIVFH